MALGGSLAQTAGAFRGKMRQRGGENIIIAGGNSIICPTDIIIACTNITIGYENIIIFTADNVIANRIIIIFAADIVIADTDIVICAENIIIAGDNIVIRAADIIIFVSKMPPKMKPSLRRTPKASPEHTKPFPSSPCFARPREALPENNIRPIFAPCLPSGRRTTNETT